MSIREKLIKKIEIDTGYIVKNGSVFYRPTLNWVHKTAGRMVWYWLIDGICVGSAENMKELLKSPEILMTNAHFGFVEFSSS